MKLLVSIIFVLMLSSCATILNDDTQSINVTTSNNEKAKFTINGRNYTAPAIINVERSQKDAIIQVKNSKCASQYLLKPEVDTKFFINILSGGTFGSSTDYGTEKMWKYQDSVNINCK